MRLRSSAVLMMTAALVLGACGDDDDDDSAGLPGPPIEIGLVNTENSPAGNYVDGRDGVEAAVRYVNEELDGVNGRPLALETCITDGSPEASIRCANKFVQAEKTAVLTHIDLGASAAVPIYTNAGMPYIGGVFNTAEEATAATGFVFIGGSPPALAAYAGQEMKAKRVTVLGPDIPLVGAAVDTLLKPVFAKLGVTEVTTVQESPTAADFTPALTRVKDTEPDAVIMFFGGPTCSKVMQAAAQVQLPPEQLLFGQECANAELIDAGDGGGDGALYASPFLSPDSDDPNVVIFRDRLERYSPGAVAGVSSQGGFNTVMNLHAVLNALDPTTIAPDTVIAALKATKDLPGFMSHAFTCGGTVFPALPAICDSHNRLFRYQDGEFRETNGQWVDGGAFLR